MKDFIHTIQGLVRLAVLGSLAVAPAGFSGGVMDAYAREDSFQACTSVSPAFLDFGEVLVGDATTATFTISNPGAVDVNVTSIAISGSGSAQFDVGTTPFTIPPGQSEALEVRFTPDQFSSFSASLNLVCDDVAASFALSGAGTNLRAVVRPINDPVVGDSLELAVDILPESYQPDTREFLYRPTGQAQFASVPLAGSTARAVIPAEAVTLRGLDYYFRFIRGPNIRTVPGTNPESNPIRLRVRVDQHTSEMPLRPLTYQMVSVPLELDAPQLPAVLTDDLSPYDSTQWRLFRWDPTLSAYRELPDLAEPFTPGLAFWLSTRAGASFDVEDALSVDASRSYPLTLAPGWNQIASPFAFPVAWASVAGSGQVEAPVAFDGVEYRYGQAVLEPWQGYFVFNPTAGPVTLFIPPVEASVAKAASSSFLAEASYAVQMKASVPGEGLRDSENYLGFAPEASAGRDRLDVAEPPGIGDFLRVSVVENTERLAASLKPGGGDGQVWPVEVEAVLPGEVLAQRRAVEVELQEHSARPEGFALYVFDEDRGRRVMVEQGRFTVEVSPGQVRHLRVVIGTAAYAEQQGGGIPLEPLEDALLQNYPNPFNPQTVIGYQLSERGEVELVVYDVLGRRVRVLARGERAAGRYEEVWDGRDDGGVPVASGMFFCRLKTGSYQATRRMVLQR